MKICATPGIEPATSCFVASRSNGLYMYDDGSALSEWQCNMSLQEQSQLHSLISTQTIKHIAHILVE